MYTCQLSRIKDNFSRLTHKSGRVVLKKLHFISDLLCIISLLLITIAKALKCLQSVRIVSVQRSSDIFGNVRKSLEIVGNLRKWLGRFRKSRSQRDKNLTRLTQKKLAGIKMSQKRLFCVTADQLEGSPSQ